MEDIPHDPIPVNDNFPDEQLAVVKVQSLSDHWFRDYANFFVAKFLPPGLTFQQRKKFFHDLRHYFWDDPHIYREGADGIMRRCIPEHEQKDILRQCHDSPYGDIMPVKGPHIKFYNQVFIGLLSLRTPEGTFYLVISVRELVTFQGVTLIPFSLKLFLIPS